MANRLIFRVHGDSNILCYRGFSSFETTGFWMQPRHTYKAFISYSHHDRKWGFWLHRKLERYRFPPKVRSVDRDDSHSPYLMRPVFRDREELTAGHDLGRKIEAALKRSEALIVICSPASAKSHWVNQEILYFKRHNRDARIFSVIVEGEPFSVGETECFPDALRYTVDEEGALTRTPAEPLAADLRNIGDGKRLGLLKLLSGLANIGLDDLVQRDLRRSRQRVMTITLSALAIVIAMGSLLINAMNAREEADFRRNIAEEQIEFMLTDLKEEVKKVGRLDVLDVVIRRAADYYEVSPPTIRQPNAYARLSRVNMNLGEISSEYGDASRTGITPLAPAKTYFEHAHRQAKELYDLDPQNPDYVFNYAQATFWLGSLSFSKDTAELSRTYLNAYKALADQLHILEPETLRGQLEPIMAEMNLAAWQTNFYDIEISVDFIDGVVSRFEEILEDFPTDAQLINEIAYSYAWQADAQPDDESARALIIRQKQLALLQSAYERDPHNIDLQHRILLGVAGVSKMLLDLDRAKDAKELLEMHLTSSERLWRLNISSKFYFENFALLNLYLADAASSLGDKSSAEGFLATYDELNAYAGKYSVTSSDFFERHNSKRLRVGARIKS